MWGPKHQLMDLTSGFRIGPKIEGGLKFGFSNWVECYLEFGPTRYGGKVVAHECHFIFPIFWIRPLVSTFYKYSTLDQ